MSKLKELFTQDVIDYYKNNQRLHRTYFQKHKLKERLDEFYEELTEYENMVLNGYTRLFDYGNYIFLKRY